jgi:DNA polymerase III epsilon subunit-like protein
MQLVVADTETGGLDSKVHSLLSVGMWTLDTVKGTIDNPLYFLVKEPEIVTTPYAMNVNGLRLQDIDSEGLDPKKALEKVRDYCKPLSTPAIHQPSSADCGPNPVGHNIGFDIGFLNRLVSLSGDTGILPFHYRTIDVPSILTTMYLAGILPKDISSSQKALEYFGMKRGKVHNALDDAECTGKVYLKILGMLSDGNSVLDSALGPLNPMRCIPSLPYQPNEPCS